LNGKIYVSTFKRGNQNSAQTDSFPLTSDYRLPSNATVTRGDGLAEVVVVAAGNTVFQKWLWLEGEGSRIDVIEAQEADKDDIDAFFQPFAAPPAPILRTPRVEGVSQLGFVVGELRDFDLTFGEKWTWTAFHIPFPVKVGAVRSSIQVGLHSARKTVPLRLYDHDGNLRLDAVLKGEIQHEKGDYGPAVARFDDVILQAGDYALCFYAPRFSGSGSKSAADSLRSIEDSNPRGTFASEPTAPKLDELIQRPGREVAVPLFRFAAN
jgi:hypothetical protein